jgi:hypothetical protein
MTRHSLWSDLPVDRHLALVDDALDTHEVAVAAMEVRLQEQMKVGFARCEEDSKSQKRLLVGLLVSIVASSVAILLTVALTVGAG